MYRQNKIENKLRKKMYSKEFSTKWLMGLLVRYAGSRTRRTVGEIKALLRQK